MLGEQIPDLVKPHQNVAFSPNRYYRQYNYNKCGLKEIETKAHAPHALPSESAYKRETR